MALRRRGNQSEGLNAWPGYVDALSTLLMVIIFVLLVFVLAQAFLSVALSGRDRALDRLGRQMAEISDLLSLERGRTAELQLSVAGLNRDLTDSRAKAENLSQQLAGVGRDQARIAAERDALRTERDRLFARLSDADLQSRSAQSRNEALQLQLTEIAKRGDTASQASAVNATQAATNAARAAENLAQFNATAAQLADARRTLADTQAMVAEMKKAAAETDRVVQADRATMQARLSDIAKLTDQLRALTALRDELERQTQDAAARATTEAERARATAVQLNDEKRLGESARAQVALLNQQLDQLRLQMAGVARALDVSEAQARDKDTQIANLGSRLNAALAQKVEELQRYRSDFFGRLREVLANRPGITVVGDRFVFQSEVLFPVGSADLSQAGGDQMRALATTLKQLAKEIPPDVNWLLRVDGHADRQPVTGRFTSNWELSASRAITVVKLLVAEGIPANRLAATGFGEFQPLDNSDTPDSFARNRRIELRLTDR
jgi:chemotaxis protein MotB